MGTTHAENGLSSPETPDLQRQAPLISVIVPVYKVERYLAQCVESLLNQTYRNLEILLIDDGSPDSCGEICESYSRQDSRVKTFHKENGGLSSARNYALDRVHGEWIGFIDSDDWAEPNMYETLLRAALSNGVEIASCGYTLDYTTGPKTVQQWENRLLCGRDEIAFAFFKKRIFRDYVWSKLFHRSFFEDGTRFPVGQIYEDGVITTAIFRKIDKLVCVEDCLYHYRARRSSIIHNPSLKTQLGLWTARKSTFDARIDLVPAYRTELMAECCNAVRLVMRALAHEKPDAAALPLLREITLFAKEHAREVLAGPYKIGYKVPTFMAQYPSPFSYWLVDVTNTLYTLRKPKNERAETDLFP